MSLSSDILVSKFALSNATFVPLHLEASNEVLVEIQERKRDTDAALGDAKGQSIEAKRAAERSQQACVKFEVSQRERRLLRKNTIQSKKAELVRVREETRRMQVAQNKLEEKETKYEKELKTDAMKMEVGIALKRAAVEGYDKRMGSNQEFEKFDQLRRVTKGGFPAEVVEVGLLQAASS